MTMTSSNESANARSAPARSAVRSSGKVTYAEGRPAVRAEVHDASSNDPDEPAQPRDALL